MRFIYEMMDCVLGLTAHPEALGVPPFVAVSTAACTEVHLGTRVGGLCRHGWWMMMMMMMDDDG